MSAQESKVGILVIDNDPASHTALRQVLDSEGWNVRVVQHPSEAFTELATGQWALTIANIATTDLRGPLFGILRELALSPAIEGEKTRVRVLFLVPELSGPETQPILERDHLPYVLKPFNLHDFLEKVSDLLLEAKAIGRPIRQVRYQFQGSERRFGKGRPSGHDGRQTSMFASREDYMMTEEEIAEYERQEQEAERNKKKKKPREL